MKWPKGMKPPVKLTDEQRLEVCRLLAQFETPVEIHKRLKEQHGVEVALPDIYKYIHAPKWKPFIAAARQEWVKGLVEIPLSHKRRRVEELVKLVEQAKRDPKLSEARRRREVAAHLQQIQEEVDEKHTHFTNITATQYVGVSYEDLLKRRDALIENLKQYGGSHGREVDRIGQAAVDQHDRPSGEGDRTDGGHDQGSEARSLPSDGSEPQVQPV